ncbi:MAG TPA: glycosidase, partial [Mobilitalea sp.]|nr:glycosidase [Mobilitalea sp.]
RPYDEYIKNMFFRKPGLPILMVRMPDGSEVPYWNTFYQEVKYNKITSYELIKNLNIQYVTAERIANLVNSALDEGKKPSEIDFKGFEKYKDDVIDLLEAKRQYLGQMDLNIKSPLVWEFYDDTLNKLKEYGASIIRLDAFAYAPKEPGEKNFMNEPGTWELLERVRELADKYQLTLLPEIHSRYEEKVHEKLAEKGYLTYDFFLPGLIIDALERHNNKYIVKWFNDIIEKNIKTVNMLGCHDGIPLLDLKGLIPDDEIDQLISTIVSRGGLVKDLHGKKNIYYQVNSTYFSALGEDERKLLLARAIQIFTPGIPQVWYLDLFAGRNDYEAVKKAGPGGHKEINRTNLTMDQVKDGLKTDIVRRQLELLRFRNTFPAFGFDAKLQVIESEPHILKLRWEKDSCSATLAADLRDYSFEITAVDENNNIFTI